MDDLLDQVPTDPVGVTCSGGPSRHTAYRRLVRTPSGLRLAPSRYLVVVGVVLLVVYLAVGVLFHEQIAGFLGGLTGRFPVSWLAVGVGGLAVVISFLGPMAAYPLALRFGTTVDFDTTAREVRITSAGVLRTVPFADVRAVQVCRAALGTAQRRVFAYELNLVIQAGAGPLDRTCMTCGGPKTAIVRQAQSIGEALESPVVTSPAGRSAT